MQRDSRENIRRILEEQEKLSHELEAKRKKIDIWSREINKQETLTERERQKLGEDGRKVMLSGPLNLSKRNDWLSDYLYCQYQ